VKLASLGYPAENAGGSDIGDPEFGFVDRKDCSFVHQSLYLFK
jgi:hypothetical protein